MAEFLARYTLREKLIVGVGLLVLVVLVLHALVIEPYQLRSVELADEIEQQRDDLEWMRNAVANMPADLRSAPTQQIEGTLASFVDQVVRPTGLVDPEVEVRPASTQVDDLLSEIRLRVEAGDRVLVEAAGVAANFHRKRRTAGSTQEQCAIVNGF